MITPKPFVKWAGGKKQLLPKLKANLPSFNKYVEPFVGGGALFWSLAPQKAIIGDVNFDLINAYTVIRDDVNNLIVDLMNHKNEAEYYYQIRGVEVETLTPLKRASRLIYLNKTCFNGLYRENSKGKFNVPFGRYKNPNICDTDNLLAVSSFLSSNDITIINGDYKQTCSRATEGDLVYFDPPYHRISKTSFTKYSKSDFDETNQRELAEFSRSLSEKKCFVMLSNHKTELIKNIYQGFHIQEVAATRFINASPEGRAKADIEVVIRNFNVESRE